MLMQIITEQVRDIKKVTSIFIFDDDHADKYEKIIINELSGYDVIEKYKILTFNELPELQDLEKCIKRENQNVFIIDLNMGNGHEEGIDFIKEIKTLKLNRDNIFVLSAGVKDNVVMENKCYKAGARWVLDKEEVVEKIREIIDKTEEYLLDEITSEKNIIESIVENRTGKRVESFTQVVEFDEEKVLLLVKKNKNSDEEKRLWFDIRRIDDPKKIQNDFSYLMIDEVLENGTSVLRFERIEDNSLINNDELEEAFNVLYNNKNLFSNGQDNNNS